MLSLTLLTALAATAAAIPAQHAHFHQKRDLVIVTDYTTITDYIDVIETVWVTPGAMPTGKQVLAQHNQIHHPKPTITQYVPESQPAIAPPTILPASEYVAPSPVVSFVAPPPVTTAPAPVAPAPTTPAYVPPPPPATSAAAPPPTGGSGDCDSTSAGASCSNAYFSYYSPSVGLGACGWQNSDSDDVFAIASTVFAEYMPGGNPNDDTLCGRTISITAKDGSTFTAKLVDRCPGCADMTHLDLSPGLWNKLQAAGDPSANGLAKGYTWTWQ